MSIRIKQDFTYEGEDWWSWSIWIDGPKAELDAVAYVQYTLHHTFPNPVRRIDDRATKFRLQSSGWGTFTIYALIVGNDGRKTKVTHDLELYYPEGNPSEA